jgi:hypothetical protein
MRIGLTTARPRSLTMSIPLFVNRKVVEAAAGGIKP